MKWIGDIPIGMINPRKCPVCGTTNDVDQTEILHTCNKCHTKIDIKAMNARPSFINVAQVSFGIIDDHVKMLKLLLEHPKSFWKELSEEIIGCEQTYRGAKPARPATVNDDVDAPGLDDHIPLLDD